MHCMAFCTLCTRITALRHPRTAARQVMSLTYCVVHTTVEALLAALVRVLQPIVGIQPMVLGV